ncbi:SLAM family member 7-like isoform X2 [Anoplopoma fimbria]|uniref:SLAM family member 7-like isoform X2 n=1 Tax=Anoplopoma fimbria TaxID=229290 RepID=UPI0023EC48B3|nr:SLAM family member 7-like isoform X2 [Anoplopoma fimbria]
MRRTTRGENVKVILPFCRMGPWVALLFIVYLLRSCETEGPIAVTPVFVKKGDDLILNVDDVPEDVLIVDWNFNKTVKLVRFTSSGQPTVFVDFIGRIEFPVKEFSVKLKNLQKADSGVYTAKVLTALGDKLAEYKVTVEDPVSPVKLTVDPVDPVDPLVSRSSCNLTVTCSTQDSHISSTIRCVNQTCSQEGGEQPEVTTSGASLRVYLLNSSIICNHSNHVSWTKDVKMIEDFCPKYADPPPPPPPPSSNHIVIVICVMFPLIIMAVLLGLFLHHRQRGTCRTYSPTSGSESDR